MIRVSLHECVLEMISTNSSITVLNDGTKTNSNDSIDRSMDF